MLRVVQAIEGIYKASGIQRSRVLAGFSTEV